MNSLYPANLPPPPGYSPNPANLSGLPRTYSPYYSLAPQAGGVLVSSQPSTQYTHITNHLPLNPHLKGFHTAAPTQLISGEQKNTAIQTEAPKDLFRHTPLRYMGYLNELGESFKDLLKASPFFANNAEGIVKHSYTATGAYVGLDAIDKTIKGFKQSKNAGESHTAQVLTATTSGLDAALFQYGASYSIPAFMVAVTRDSLKLGLNRLLGKTDKANEIIKTEIMHEIEAKGWHRFDQRLLGKLKKSIDDHLLQKLSPSQKLAETVQKWGPKAERNLCIALPMVSSLAIIPFIVHPIDHGMNFLLDHSYRPLVKMLKHRTTGH